MTKFIWSQLLFATSKASYCTVNRTYIFFVALGLIKIWNLLGCKSYIFCCTRLILCLSSRIKLWQHWQYHGKFNLCHGKFSTQRISEKVLMVSILENHAHKKLVRLIRFRKPIKSWYFMSKERRETEGFGVCVWVDIILKCKEGKF